MSSLPILLAPAGSPDAFFAACAAGADAVYLGGKQFGARQFATNFSDEELKQAVRYAHLRGVRVYVTVNTLVTEREMKEALYYLLFLFSIGVDAVLVQDTGLLSCARQNIPDLVLHASTQMGIHNIPGALYAAKNGCSRIVLARELNGKEIKEIGDALSGYPVDLEVFAHGALCYAYSGRCLLSSLVGGRSGNRGMCAQPCRKQYKIMEGSSDLYGRTYNAHMIRKAGYLLSTKDLSLYPVLDKIVQLPVAALKIEGRMRSPAYVAIVTSLYRKALDAIRNKAFHPDPENMADLSIAFSRGFTSGYINGSEYSEVIGRNYPGNQGYYLGFVLPPGGQKISLKLSSGIIPRKGDGLVFRTDGWEEGYVPGDDPVIRNGIVEFSVPFRVRAGAGVYMTSRQQLEKKIRHLLSNPDKRYIGSITISCSITFTSDGKITSTGIVKDRRKRQYQFEFTSKEIVQEAKTRPLTKEQIREQLTKTGGTFFTFTDIEISGEERWFAPLSVLNSLRREIFQAAEDAIIRSGFSNPDIISQIRDKVRNYTFTKESVNLEPAVERPGLVVLVSSVPEARSALENGADQVYLLWNSSHDDISGLTQSSNNIGIMVPGVIRQQELKLFTFHLNQYASPGIRHFLVDSVGMGEFILDNNSGFSVSSYYGLPVTNSSTLKALHDYEFCTLSPELSEQEISDICQAYHIGTGPSPAICCQGLIEAAVTEDHLCEYTEKQKGTEIFLLDEKKYSFPVWCEQSGRSHIMNSSEHSLIIEYPKLYQMGIRCFIIDARGRGERYTEEMTRIWKRRLQSDLSFEEVSQMKEAIISMSHGEITKSGYKRGLSGLKPRNQKTANRPSLVNDC
ncbi:DUF3656 domain-containing protein [Methanospirillum sp.]|uniref:U32 family peptidase n=1 Tax=Methanospirillum sp. TaxID=45200 RepID=UPI0035A0C875